MKFKVSVIICTHNPRIDIIKQVLSSLETQSLDMHQWEILLIDNLSNPPISDFIDMSWHPNSKFFIAAKLGLTNARIVGIENSNSDLLVFVDDDNILDENYLNTALKLSQSHTFLGAYSGNSVPRFENSVLPNSQLNLDSMLALRKISRDIWSNDYFAKLKPIGAGLVIRKNVGLQFVYNVRNNPELEGLGRQGKLLLSAEDTELVLTAIDLNYGFGLFSDLVLYHYIPTYRTNTKYLIQLSRSIALSNILLNYYRFGKKPFKSKFGWLYNIIIKWYRIFRFNKLDRNVLNAKDKAVSDFYTFIEN